MRIVTLAMQYSLGFSFSNPYFSSASTTAKSAVSLVESRMVLYGMLGFRLSAYIRRVPPAGRYNTDILSAKSFACNLILFSLRYKAKERQIFDDQNKYYKSIFQNSE